MKRSLILAGSLLLSLSACKGEEVSATVNCKVLPPGTVECSVAQTKGKSEIEVCWDFSVSCTDGSSLVAERSCGKVKDGGSTTVTIPDDKLEAKGACQGEMTAVVENMTVNGKKFDQ